MAAESYPLVSVVTPFYNTDEYLSECILSVIQQSYTNWEYILVDNQSSDRSNEIAKKYEKQDSRIKVIKNVKFLTQVQNYNYALSLISPHSKYCKIVQADDWIFENCLREMVNVAESNPSVGIVGAYRLDDARVTCDGLPYPSSFVSGRDICRRSLLDGIFVFGTATSILLRADLVRNRQPFYSEFGRHEDTESCYEILQQSDFGFVHQVLTFTRRENESLTSRVKLYDPFYLLDKYIVTIKYGPFYLNETEYAECIKNIENRYYRFIGERILTGDRNNLIDYHNEGLKHINRSLCYKKALIYSLVFAVGFIIKPHKALRGLCNKVARRT